MKCVFISNIPTPYQLDFLNVINLSEDLRAEFWFCSETEPNRLWRYACWPKEVKFLGNNIWLGKRNYLNTGVVKALKEADADIFVIGGYTILTNLLAVRTLNGLGKKWFIWLERPGFVVSLGIIRRIKEPIRRAILRRLFRQASGVLCIGKLAVDVFRDIYPEGHYYNFPYSCDLKRYFSIERTEKESGHNIDFLYVGQVIKRKGISLLIKAFNELAEEYNNIRLTITGSGSDLDYYKSLVPDKLKNRVLFTGFIDQDRLPSIYASNDIFVMPANFDGWGVVVNEGMAAAMPVIATDKVGAAYDLVKNGINGRLISVGDETALLEGMKSYIDEPQKIHKEGQRAREEIRKLGSKVMVERLYNIFLGVRYG